MQRVSPSPLTDRDEDEINYTSIFPAWHKNARCLGMEETVFFGASDPNIRPQYTLTNIKNARQICAKCPVARICLEQTLKHRDEFGVFAGTTSSDRKKMLKRLDLGKTTVEDEIEAFLHWLKEKVDG